MSEYRLTFDVPYTFATEPGLTRAVHCADFRPEKNSFNDTWQEPATRLVMLKPSFLSRSFKDDFKALSEWSKQSDFWQEVKRGQDGITMLSSVKPASKGFPLIELLISLAIVTIQKSVELKDDLLWALQSNFNLEVDEGFVIHYYGLTDELLRKNNWFYVQWDDIGVHFSHDGIVRVYQYDRSDLTQPPVQIDEKVIGAPSEFLNHPGYFAFIPIPGFGLVLQHRQAAPQSVLHSVNVLAGTSRGVFIPWQHHIVDDKWRNFERSPVRIALNPYNQHLLGFQVIRYPASGTYLDAAFDPMYTPSAAPTQVAPILLQTEYQNVTAAARTLDDSGAYAPLTNRQGRIKCTLNSPDNIHTPFLGGYGFRFDPVYNVRNTTPVAPDLVNSLEWTEDEYGRKEGSAEVILDSDEGQAIAESGDSTFLLERSEDGGANWYTVFGGFAKEWDVVLEGEAGIRMFYVARVKLFDIWERFRETHQFLQTAADQVTPGEAINEVLRGNGFTPMASLPAETTAFVIPGSPQGESFRLGAKIGDTGEELIFKYLTFLRKSGEEWRLVYDWESGAWNLEKKPKDDADLWYLSPLYSDAANQVMRYRNAKLRPTPPEANIVTVMGITEPNAQGVKIIAPPLVNTDSLSNVNSRDYLGRYVFFPWEVAELGSQEEANKAARRIYDAIAHWRGCMDLDIPEGHARAELTPNKACVVYKLSGWQDEATPILTPILSGWVKKVTTIVTQGFPEAQQLEVDTVWEGEMR